jgi:hemerythrin-like domain-containing protein
MDRRSPTTRMHALLESLLAEHQDLRRLVTLLDRQPSLHADAAAPDAGLLVDALFYLTRFPDVTHHALEDRIAERLLARHALDPDLCAEIEAQHARMARQGLDLMRDLEGAMRQESMSSELVTSNIRLYAERLRHNMAFEELALFPAAARSLDDDDWQAIGPRAQRDTPDPLFDSNVQQRFAQLHRAISAESGCGCDLPRT